MNTFIMGIKALIKHFIAVGSKAEPIEDLSDYRRVKRWVKKICILYGTATVIAILAIVMLPALSSFFEYPSVFVYIIAPPMILLTCWGYATLIMYLPDVIKSVIKSGSTGYKIGENIETTHVEVTHEYGNTYKVSSYTENKGCLFAVIAGTARLMVWTFFCVYIGPFITFKKLRNSIKNLRHYASGHL